MKTARIVDSSRISILYGDGLEDRLKKVAVEFASHGFTVDTPPSPGALKLPDKGAVSDSERGFNPSGARTRHLPLLRGGKRMDPMTMASFLLALSLQLALAPRARVPPLGWVLV
jgi:hypothetical protein